MTFSPPTNRPTAAGGWYLPDGYPCDPDYKPNMPYFHKSRCTPRYNSAPHQLRWKAAHRRFPKGALPCTRAGGLMAERVSLVRRGPAKSTLDVVMMFKVLVLQTL